MVLLTLYLNRINKKDNMNNSLKRGAIVLLIFFAFGSMHGQTTKTLTIDSIALLEPVIMNDTTDFRVRVRVTYLGSPAAVFGDLFYYYLTDSMIQVLAPPRIFLQGDSGETASDGMFDTIPIDIRPDEIRTTTPLNTIILWPAMISPETLDSVSDTIQVGFNGWLGLPPIVIPNKSNIVFPCPALQYIYIRQEELSLIKQIRILSVEGKMISQYENSEFNSGFINVDHLASGNYLVELLYFSSKIIQTKILKR